MTSLSRQLEGLKVAASSQLGVERPYVSLLFDRKEAAALYKEDVLKIGKNLSVIINFVIDGLVLVLRYQFFARKRIDVVHLLW